MNEIKLYVDKEMKNPPLVVEVADSFLRRFMGLMGRKKLPENRGLLLTPCDSVHMCWMRFSIDVVYVDRDFRVLKVVENLRPWLGVSMCRGAWGALELTAGTAKQLVIESGNYLYKA